MSKILSKYSGFTLIELIIVIAVLAGLASLILVTYPASQRKARDAQRQSDIKQFQTALEVYATRNNNRFPTSSGNISSLCSAISLSPCPDDPSPSQNYSHVSTATEYQIWAQMEYPDADGNTQWFVTCSNGQVGFTTSVPSGASCVL